MNLYLGILCVVLAAAGISEAQRLRGCRRQCPKTVSPVCALNGKTFRNNCLLNCSGRAKQCNGPCPCRRAPPQPRRRPNPPPATEGPEIEGTAPPQRRRRPQPAQHPPVYPPQPQPAVQPRPPVVRPTPPPTPAPAPAPAPAPTPAPFFYDPFYFLFEPFQPVFAPTQPPVYAPTSRPDHNDRNCYCGNEKDPVCTIDGEEYDNSCKATCEGKIIACESACPCM